MSKTRILIAAASLAVASVPALASSDGFQYVGGETGWTLAQYRADAAPAPAREAAAPNAFRYAGGETGWEVAPHVLEVSNGRIVHSAECDHEMHAAPTFTMADVNRAARQYPGG